MGKGSWLARGWAGEGGGLWVLEQEEEVDGDVGGLAPPPPIPSAPTPFFDKNKWGFFYTIGKDRLLRTRGGSRLAGSRQRAGGLTAPRSAACQPPWKDERKSGRADDHTFL